MMDMNKGATKESEERLGIDVGGVIIDRTTGEEDTSFFGENYLWTPAVDGSFAGLRRLVDERFGDRVYVVSRCGLSVERKTREWLDHHRFPEITGIPRENLRFCRYRWEKAEVCRELGITHFIDDRPEVLGYMEDVPHRYLFHPTEEEIREHVDVLTQVRRVNSWEELLRELLSE